MSLRSVVNNAGWLGLVYVASYGLPVLTVPVVTRAFGPELYGIYALGIAYTSFVKLAVDYGFIWTVTKEVTAGADDPVRLSRVYSTVLAAQFGLALVTSALFVILMTSLGFSQGHPAMFLLLLLSSVLWSLSPLWLFTGLQRMRDLAISQLVARIGAAVATLILIRGPTDLILYAVINLGSNLVVFLDVNRRARSLGIVLVRPPMGAVRKALVEARSPFFANMATSLYTVAAIILVNAIVDTRAAGIFAFADRVRGLLVGLLTPLSVALFPYVSKIGARRMTAHERTTKQRYIGLVFLVMSGAGIGTFVLAPWIVHFLGGHRFDQAIILLRVVAFLPILAAVKDLIGVQTLVPQGHLGPVSRIMVSSAVLGIPVLALLTHMVGILGAMIGLLLMDAGTAIRLAHHWQRTRRRATAVLAAESSTA